MQLWLYPDAEKKNNNNNSNGISKSTDEDDDGWVVLKTLLSVMNFKLYLCFVGLALALNGFHDFDFNESHIKLTPAEFCEGKK